MSQKTRDLQNPFIQTQDVRLREEEVEVLERLGRPERLHLVAQKGRRARDVRDGRVSKIGARVSLDRLEHLPALFLPGRVAGDSVPRMFDLLVSLGAWLCVGLGDWRWGYDMVCAEGVMERQKECGKGERSGKRGG